MADKKVVGGLKWVKGEIGSTLRPVRELAESRDASGASLALDALNQVHGVLLALQLSTPARLVQEMARLADRLDDTEAEPSAQVLDVMGQAITHLLGHLDRLDAGFDEPPLSLWSIINEVRAACEELPLSHSELLTFAALNAEGDSQWMPEALDVLGEVMRQVRPQFHRHLVDWYRGDPENHGLRQLSRLFRQLHGYLKEGFLADLFRLSEVFVDALMDQRLPSDQRARTLMGHLDWVLKPLVQQPPQWPEVDTLTLIEQLLGVLTESGIDSPLVAQLDAWYGTAKVAPPGSEESSAVAGDDALADLAATLLDEFGGLKEQFDLLARGERTDQASLDTFCADLRRIAATLDVAEVGNLPGRLRTLADNFGALDPATLGRDQVRLESYAMELLGIEAVLMAYADHRSAAGGQIIAPDMDLSELTAATLREASYELLRVKELIADCHSEHDPLASLSSVQGHLGSVSGALRILGETEAANLAESIADVVRRLFVGLGNQPSTTEFEHLADAIAGLELYIGHIQEAMPFGETMIERAIQAVAELEAEASRRPSPSEAIEDHDLDVYLHEETLAESVPLTEGQENTADVETAFIDIFLEEAREETESARTQFALWESNPQDAAALASLRRSFHTLKGSGRLVGALQVGDFAQAVEYLLNRLIEVRQSPSAAILACVAEAVRVLPDLVSAEAEGRQFDIDPLIERANGLREGVGVAAARETVAAAPVVPAPVGPAGPTETLDHDSLFAADEELLGIFRAETQEHLGVLRDFLARAERGDACPDEPLQRALHTLTGSARMAGMESIARVTKALELHVRPALAGALALDGGLLALLRRAVVAVAARVEELPARGIGADDLASLIEELDHRPLQSPDAIEIHVGAPAASEQTLATVDTGIELDFLSIAEEEKQELQGSGDQSVAAERDAGVAEEPESATLSPTPLDTDLPAHVAEPVSAPEPEPEPDALANAVPAPDSELAALFLEDARDLLDKLDTQFREWQLAPEDRNALDGINRLLHTLKGSARLTGLAVIGDLSHALETRLKELGEDHGVATDGTLELAQRAVDAISVQVDALEQGRAIPRMADLVAELAGAVQEQPAVAEVGAQPATEVPTAPLPIAAVTRLAQTQLLAEQATGGREGPAAATPQIRVRSDLLNRLVNHAGEISIYRGRLTQRNGLLGFSLGELDQTVTRLREQLRHLEIETQTQILHRYERAGASSAYDAEFDPLELDRFSTLQQLSGSLAETVNDLISVKEMLGGYQREFTDLLNQQARLADDLQDGLLRTRLIPFVQVVPRLHRLVRQTADTLGKSARLEVLGPEVELDRTILDRLVAPLEHLLRNAIDHGLEDPKTRVLHGKPATGRVTLALRREGNDAVITLSDDGKGLDLHAIRKQAIARGLMAADARLPDEALLQFILEPGFTTSGKVTQISGRGVGLDVVASEIKAANGSISLGSVPGKGAHFTIRLPLTLAIIDAFLVSAGDNIYAVPHSTVEGVARISRDQLSGILQGKATSFDHRDQAYKVVSLASVLDPTQEPELGERRWSPLLLARVGEQRVALHVDTLIESQRVLVKPLGPQLAGVRWLSGGTILPDGRVAMILDALGLLRSGAVQNYRPAEAAPEVTEQPTCVLVVDDSLTVRRVTSRLLRRQNIEVLTAKDGVEALTLLDERTPDLLLLDIEMPRMDGYELTRHIRRSERLRHLPIIMITSRTNTKHRDYAMQLGVDRYLGKPYQESELLSEIQSLLAERERLPAPA